MNEKPRQSTDDEYEPATEEVVQYVLDELNNGVDQPAIRSMLTREGLDRSIIDYAIIEAFEQRRQRSITNTEPAHDIEAFLYRPIPTPKFLEQTALFGGRIDRAGYWIGTLYLLVIAVTLCIALWWNVHFFTQLMVAYPFVTTAVLFLLVTIMTVLDISLFTRRRHDCVVNDLESPYDYSLSTIAYPYMKSNPNPNKWGPPQRSHNPLVILGLKRPTQPNRPN